jgi:hypothetical protein
MNMRYFLQQHKAQIRCSLSKRVCRSCVCCCWREYVLIIVACVYTAAFHSSYGPTVLLSCEATRLLYPQRDEAWNCCSFCKNGPSIGVFVCVSDTSVLLLATFTGRTYKPSKRILLLTMRMKMSCLIRTSFQWFPCRPGIIVMGVFIP